MKPVLNPVWKSTRFLCGVMSIYLGAAILYLQWVDNQNETYRKTVLRPAQLALSAGPKEKYAMKLVGLGGNGKVTTVVNPYSGRVVPLEPSGPNLAASLIKTREKLKREEAPRLMKAYESAIAQAPITIEGAGIQVTSYGASLFAFCVGILFLTSLLPARNTPTKA